MIKTPPRISLFSPGQASWIQRDAELLGHFGSVTEVDVLNMSFGNILAAVRAVVKARLCFFWFGSFRHFPLVLLAKLLGKKIVIVAGGYDVNRLDSIQYGEAKAKGARHFLFNLADTILAVSEFTRQSALKNLDLAPEKVKTIPLAFRAPDVPLVPWCDRPRQVAFLLSAPQDMYLVKGVDRIPALCRALPSVEFKFAGRLGAQVESILLKDKPKNLELLGFLEFQSAAFAGLLNQSRVLCVPSRMESFAAAALDGAAMGCIPVGFAVGALPEVLQGLGRLVSSETVAAMAATLESVLQQTEVDVQQTRRLAITRFSFEKRQQALGQVVEPLLADS